MYNVYINHFNRNNVTVNTEELMFSVPLTNNALINKPIVKSNEDAADTFSFSMDVNSPYYDSILPYKTEIRVEYDGDVIFWGRALPPSTSTVLHTKTVQCEGTYAYFNDTYYEGVQEKHRENITVSDYLTKVINNHNNMVPSKQIFRGEVYITLPSTQEKYEPTAWTQTTSILSDLTSNNGGHMRIRYTNGDAYLDWYKYYIRDLGDGARPSVTVGKNIIDISSDASNRERFTRVIPIGATDKDGKTIYIDGYKYKDKDNVEHTYSGKVMPVSFVRNLYTSTQLTDEFHNWTDYRDAEDNYGIIYKTMSFADADTQEKLFDEVKKWIKESYFSIASSFTVKAIDMHIIDGNVPKILLGDCVDVTFLMTVNGEKQWITKKLVCKAVQYDLYNPENNSYTFGVPSDLLNAANRHKSSKKSASENVGNRNKATPKGTEDNDITWRKVWHMIGSRTGNPEFEGTAAAESFYYNGEVKGATRCYDPNDIQDHQPLSHLNLWFDAQHVGKITLSGRPVRYVAVSADRGIFAYEVSSADGPKVVYWYDKHKGYKYEGPSAGLSTFEDIAKMIEKDTTNGYGGTAAAESFRNNGRINGTVKCYDPNKTSSPSSHPEEVFQANIVGKFSSSISSTIYVASAVQYGIFAYIHAASIEPVTHWYMVSSGNSYDNTSQLVHEEKTESTFATDDGTPDGNKTIWFKPTELTGYGSEGTAVFGYDTTSPTDKWRIKLNYPVQYTDADGNVRVADGFVSASDFAVQEIPSFKTKIGIFDIVIAGKVEAQQISADLAEVRKWLGDTIVANTGIRTDRLHANRINSTSYELNVPSSGGGGYDIAYLNNCFSSCLVYAGTGTDSGKIFFDFYKIGGGLGQTVNFNIADTQFYKDAVSAAWNNGGATAYFTASRTSLEPGQSTTIYAYYTNYNGQSARSYASGSGKYSSLTIEASGGGGGGDVSFVANKCYATSVSSPQATDDDGNYHNCIKVKSLGTIDSSDKSIRVIFKVGETQYNYYFGINGN